MSKLSANGLKVLEKRYFLKNEEGQIVEVEAEMWHRVAGTLSKAGAISGSTPEEIERNYRDYTDVLANLDFMPNSPTLANAGCRTGQLSACFVLPVGDSLVEIFNAIRDAALIHQTGGGTGFAFSRLRPSKDMVNSTKGESSGPISFMDVFNAATDSIKQGGMRRGANMGILRCLGGYTMIHTLEGRKPIKDLVGTRPYVYACDPETRKVHVIQADKVFVSDTNREMVRVWMDNDTYIDCTPDHRFMLSSGEYVEAGKLRLGDSLMAFAKRILKHGASKRYVMTIGCTRGRAEYEHRVVARDVLREEVNENWHVHHVDENALNNIPGNLKMVSRSDHATEHVSNLLVNQKRIAANRRGRSIEETYGPEKAVAWKLKMSEAAKNRKKVPIENHRVVRVEPIGMANEVYDLSLPTLHNFAAEEVFVHNCDHPNIEDFIDHKEDLSKLTNFNISVAVTNEFMKAVEAGTTYEVRNPKDGKVWGTKDARTIFKRIAQRAWKTGEPGVVFIDRMNEYCPVPWLGVYEATNPCGEQSLIPYESCNLGSINLDNFVVLKTEPSTVEGYLPEIDWERLKGVIFVTTRMLNDVIDANKYPLEEIERVSLATRKIGLGVMGFARMLFRMGIPYGSDEANQLAEKLMSFIDFWSKVESVELAKKSGSFPARIGHEDESNAYFRKICTERDVEPYKHPDCDYAWLYEQIVQFGIRNSNTTTVAPTGTISMIADTSGGCEPAFALSFKRFQADTRMFETDKVFEEKLRAYGLIDVQVTEVFELVDAAHGSLRLMLEDQEKCAWAGFSYCNEVVIEELLVPLAKYMNVAHDVTPTEHVLVQAAFQKYNDSSISKTCNFPEWATVDDIIDAYMKAWLTGCKGITVYRNGCRDNQPLSVSSKPAETVIEKMVDEVMAQHETGPRIRPEDLYGFGRKIDCGDGRVYTQINYDSEGIREVVATVGRSGGTLHGLVEALGRLISLSLQYRVPVDDIAKSLIGVRGANPTGFGPNKILSIPDAIGRTLKNAPRVLGLGQVSIGEGIKTELTEALVPAKTYDERATRTAVEQMGHNPECTDCGTQLYFSEGCMTCPACGSSKCS